MDPWHVGYRSLADSMKPIEPFLDRNVTPHNPGQTTNPTTSHIMSVPNPPGSSALGAPHLILVSSIPSSAEGKPPARPMLSVTGIVASHGQTSSIDKYIVYVPPTHMNVVNPPSSSGQPLGAQPITNQTSWGYGYTTNQIPIGNVNPNPPLQECLMPKFHALVIFSCHGGNLPGITCQLWRGYRYIL